MELREFKSRELNLYERKGLILLFKEEFNFDLESIICETTEKGLLNVQNTYFGRINGKINIGFPVIGSVGLSVSNDIIICFYDEEEENRIFVCCTWRFTDFEKIKIK